MYRLQPDPNSGQDQGHDQASTSMLPPSSTTAPRYDQQHQHQHNQYPFAFDPTYHPPPPAGPSTSISAYDYSYSRGLQGDMQPPLPVNIDTMSNAFGHDPNNGWGSPYHGPGMGSASMSHDKDGERGEHGLQAWSGEGQMYADYTGQGDHGRDGRHPHGQGDNGGDWGKSGDAWGHGYTGGIEREMESLRLNLSDLVESIRPYASSPANPHPPRAPPYVSSRFVRLASEIQAALSSLQPHLHPYLHPEFNLPLPTHSRSQQSGAGTSSIKPLTAAEKEMEVIRKRRDMLIARAAQVQASSHPSAFHQQYPHQSPYHLQQSPSSGTSPHSTFPFTTHQPFSWKQGDFNHNGGMYNNGLASIPMSHNNSGSPFTAAPFDGSPGMNHSRRPLTTTDSFDASLARFSLDPTKIGAEGVKKSTPEGGKCHGCGVGVTAEWRRGPDGPRSLCNACGLHYAKLTRKRAQEEANANSNQQVVASI